MRDCNKCIHHISGSCSAWKCDMQTLEDYRNKAIDEFAEKIIEACKYIPKSYVMALAEQMKAGGKNV